MLNLQNPLAPIIVGSGLVLTINSGMITVGNAVITISQTVLNLIASSTNYIFINNLGVLTLNTTGFVSGCLPICTVVTTASTISTITDSRPDFSVPKTQLAFLTSTYTNATTTASNIPGLVFDVSANTKYVIEFNLYYQGSAGTAGLDITITGPASPTNIIYSYIEDATQTGGSQDSVATAFGTKLTGAGTITPATNLPVTATLSLFNGVNAGTVQVQGSASGNGTVTVQPGSYGKMIQL